MKKKIASVEIPASRSPFVNTSLKPAGYDPETGSERYWFSCWNHASGAVGATICADGRSRVYRFDTSANENGFYSAAYGGRNDMWLCGYLSTLVHLDLETGERTHYPTGMPFDLCGASMTLDEASGKLFCTTYCQGDYKSKAFVFDINSREIVARIENIPVKTSGTCFAMQLHDGRYLFSAPVKEFFAFFTWNPKDDEVKIIYKDDLPNGDHIRNFVMREDGCVYVPYRGWFNTDTCEICDTSLAPYEMYWLMRSGDKVYGLDKYRDGVTLRVWDIKANTISNLHTIPDGTDRCCKLMKDGRFIIVNRFCYFSIFDPVNKCICAAKKLDMDSIGFLDCIYRIDENTLLATPFITQRFLKIDLKSGRGYDMGRANVGAGEVLQTTMLNGKVYMASYTEGQLSQWDPKSPLGYPENPLVVATPGHKALRPVSMCHNDNTIFYSTSRHYGNTGGLLIAYDEESGAHKSKVCPVGERILHTLFWDKGTKSLICGSTCEADCRSVPPSENVCKIVRIDPETLCALDEWDAPDGTYFAGIFGDLGNGKYLVACMSESANYHMLDFKGEKWTRLFIFDAKTMQAKEAESGCDMLCTRQNVFFAKRDGYFVLRRGDVFSLARFNDGFEIIEDIAEQKNCIQIHIQDELLYLVADEKIHIYDLEISKKM